MPWPATALRQARPGAASEPDSDPGWHSSVVARPLGGGRILQGVLLFAEAVVWIHGRAERQEWRQPTENA